jgi:pyruvate formate lyase activating enzyme
MKIERWQRESIECYDGKLVTLVFTPRCDDNCGFCNRVEFQNAERHIEDKRVLDYLNLNKGRIEGVAIMGGEPTTKPGLVDFVKNVKDMGLLVKLYTNGARYSVLQELKNGKFVDSISMNVKGPVNLYPLMNGKRSLVATRDSIAKGISVALQFPEHEFRTTTNIIYGDNELRWMTPEEIGETAELITDWNLNGNEIKYFLQPFKAANRKRGEFKFMKDNLPEEFHITPPEHLKKCLIEAQKHIPNTVIRQ